MSMLLVAMMDGGVDGRDSFVVYVCVCVGGCCILKKPRVGAHKFLDSKIEIRSKPWQRLPSQHSLLHSCLSRSDDPIVGPL